MLNIPAFVRLGIRLDTAPAGIWLALLAASLWPTAWWMGQRMLDGSDEPLGALALAALALLLWVAGGGCAPRRGSDWLALALAGPLPPPPRLGMLPPLVSSLLGLLALGAGLAAFLPEQRLYRAGARPVAALAAPARLAAVLRRLPLARHHRRSQSLVLAAGFEVQRSGASLLVDGRLVIVDAPCSGVQMLWLGYFTACVVALHAGRRNAGFLARLPAVSALVLAGNVLRNAVLVAVEASGHHLAGWAHDAVGLVILAAVCAAIARVMHGPHGERDV